MAIRVDIGLQGKRPIHIGRGLINMLDATRPKAAWCEYHARVRRHPRTVPGTVHAPDGEIVAVEATEPGADLGPRPDAILHKPREKNR